jgi:hypothetical protein
MGQSVVEVLRVKTRIGFVTNSSSTAYIVISAASGYEKISDLAIEDGVFKVGKYGERKFGWEYKRHTSIFDRINFAYLQILDLEKNKDLYWKPHMRDVIDDVKEVFGGRIIDNVNLFSCAASKWRKMLKEVIKENEPKVKEIVYLLTSDYSKHSDGYYGYIDHQSAAHEGKNIKMFSSNKILKDFIFGKGSFVVTDNDNR